MYASGTAYIGGASSTGGLYPALNKNNTYDIGGFQYAWRDIFASGGETMMTWGEFRRWVEERDVKDDDTIRYIDWFIEPVAVEKDAGRVGIW